MTRCPTRRSVSPDRRHGPRDNEDAARRLQKSLDDPKVFGLLDRFDQPVIYMNADEYAKFARQMEDAERGTIDRLGLRGSM